MLITAITAEGKNKWLKSSILPAGIIIIIIINNVFRGETHLAYRLFYHVALHKRHEINTCIQTSNK